MSSTSNIAAAFLPELEVEMAGARRVLANVTDELLAWKPHEKSMTMGFLASHIVNIPNWAKLALTTDSLDVAPVDAPPPRTPECTSRKELLEAFDAAVVEARDVIAATDDFAMMQTWTLLAGGKVTMALPKVAVIRSFVLNHIVHHRAQLGVYLRLNNLPVPGLYGPSADENPA